MSISIRAGLLSNLCATELKNINNCIIQDVLYINNQLKRVIEYSYYYFIRTTFHPGGIYVDRPSGNNTELLQLVFPEYSVELVQRLLDDGFTDDEIISALGRFLDMKEICASSGFLVVDNWVSSEGKQGVAFEKIAIMNLFRLGYEIGEGVHSSREIIYNGVSVHLNGRPDGVIVSSPGDSIASGTLIEIKYRRQNKSNYRWKDELQLCAYGVIFEVDVLYVLIYDGGNMECTLYKNSRLLDIWNSKRNAILDNSLKLHNLIMNFPTDDSAAIRLIDLARYK